MSKISTRPAHPERICWGCDKYCPADELACGNGTIRTLHPCELFGDDWLEWATDRPSTPSEGGDRPPDEAQMPAEAAVQPAES